MMVENEGSGNPIQDAGYKLYVQAEVERVQQDLIQIKNLLDNYKIAMPGGSIIYTLVQRVQIACVAATDDT